MIVKVIVNILTFKLVETLNHFISVYNIKGTILKFNRYTRKVGQVLVNRYEDDNKLNQIWYLLRYAIAMVGSC